MTNKYAFSKATAFLIICACADLAMANSQETTVGDVVAGQSKSVACAGCHGTDGNSLVPSFPKLAGLGEKYLFKQLQDIQSKKHHIPQMTGQLDGLQLQDLRDIAAYFNGKTLKISGAKPIEVQVNSGIKVDGLELGERTFRAGNRDSGVPACTGCHSPRGLGNEPAGFPRLGGQYAEYTEVQLRAFRNGDRTNDGESQVMRQVAQHMSDAEIIALANYIAGLN
jgi:cytochrome c553